MAETAKILGQVAPSASTETTLYTVPASTVAVISTILICNQNSSSITFRLSISKSGNPTATKDYLFYDHSLRANTSHRISLGMTLDAAVVVRVYASAANVSFNAFGLELT